MHRQTLWKCHCECERWSVQIIKLLIGLQISTFRNRCSTVSGFQNLYLLNITVTYLWITIPVFSIFSVENKSLKCIRPSNTLQVNSNGLRRVPVKESGIVKFFYYYWQELGSKNSQYSNLCLCQTYSTRQGFNQEIEFALPSYVKCTYYYIWYWYDIMNGLIGYYKIFEINYWWNVIMY